MSKIAILSDIHANLPAFREVLNEIESLNVSEVFLGGDLVGYGASPAGCVDLAMTKCAGSVMGNHDEFVIQRLKVGATHPDPRGKWKKDPFGAGVLRAMEQLNPKQIEWFKNQPMFAKPEGAILLHASVDDPLNWNYITSHKCALYSLQIIRGRKRHVAFVGHTHKQKIFPDLESDLMLEQVDEKKYRIPQGLATVVSVGAVGRPRGDSDTRAAWALWDPVKRTVEFRRTEYDAAAAAKDILDAGLPAQSAKILGNGRSD
jgi:diadenosine tetraphosphatase ApaH/serine/threonine PP2A family protein phosphatase